MASQIGKDIVVKHGLSRIVGKKIVGVVVAAGEHATRQQLFLVFSDGSSFEFYGEAFGCCAGPERSEDIGDYVRSMPGEIVRVHGDAKCSLVRPGGPVGVVPNPEPDEELALESLKAKLERDLSAWLDTKALIARMKGGTSGQHTTGER